MSPPARPALASGSRSYVIPIMAGHISAPPAPITARHAISVMASGASPPARENTAKIPAPMKKTVRRPSMSARRPPVTMTTPNTTA